MIEYKCEKKKPVDLDLDVEADVDSLYCDECPDRGVYVFSVETQRFKFTLQAPNVIDLIDMVTMAEDIVAGDGKNGGVQRES